MHLANRQLSSTDSGAVPDVSGAAGAPASEALDAGALVLSRIKHDLADGHIRLREAAAMVYHAMRRVPSSGEEIPTLFHRSFGQAFVSEHPEMSLRLPDPVLEVSASVRKRLELHQISSPIVHARLGFGLPGHGFGI